MTGTEKPEHEARGAGEKKTTPGPQATGEAGARPQAAAAAAVQPSAPADKRSGRAKEKVAEIGGPKGPEPTRFGDWERNGICVDF
jgi:hypothetical protein